MSAGAMIARCLRLTCRLDQRVAPVADHITTYHIASIHAFQSACSRDAADSVTAALSATVILHPP